MTGQDTAAREEGVQDRQREVFLNEIRRRKYKGLKDDIRVLTFYLMGDKSFDILKIVAGFSIKERLKMYCDEVERREKEGTTEDDE